MIDPSETEIRGEWVMLQGKVQADENCRRIETLTQNVLTKIAADSSGWDELFVDPKDGRYWERTFPHSDWQGGGPPLLRVVSAQEAYEKYEGVLQPGQAKTT